MTRRSRPKKSRPQAAKSATKGAKRPSPGKARQNQPAEATKLRIIGGSLRGSPLLYHGEKHTRPMKERVREALFNLLSTSVKGKLAIDLFAGTGAIGLEAISRGAVGAIMLERHFPSAKLIESNAANFELQEQVEVFAADTFHWLHEFHDSVDATSPDANSSGARAGAKPVADSRLIQTHLAANTPWVVFCSPPYAFWHDRREEMLAVVGRLLAAAPVGSEFALETETDFPAELFEGLIADSTTGKGNGDTKDNSSWDCRLYPPAAIWLHTK